MIRRYQLSEGGVPYEIVTADSVEDALDEARCNVDRANYAGDEDRTLRVSVSAWSVGADGRADGEEEDSDTVTLDPEEPECSESEHEWISPYAIIGGLRENPGVWGRGGGVVIHRVCEHCGLTRIVDTAATDGETGQRYESTSYDADKYRDQWEEWCDELADEDEEVAS